MMMNPMIKLFALAKKRYPVLNLVDFQVMLSDNEKSSTYFEWGPNATIEHVVVNLAKNTSLADLRTEVVSIVSRITGKLPEIVKEELEKDV